MLGQDITVTKTASHDVIGEVLETPNRANIALRILKPADAEKTHYEQGAYVLLTKNEARNLVAELQRQIGEDPELLGITFTGEASESFADWVLNRSGWYVQLTPRDGAPFDALIADNQDDIGWHDSVTFVRADEATGEALIGAERETIRVSNVHVY